jgi:hypothetical protein
MQEIWQHLCSLVPMRDAARAACVSRLFLSSWRCHPDFTFTKETMFSKKKLRKWAEDPTDKRYIRECNRNIDHVLVNHRGPGVQKFMLHFHGPYNTKSYNRLNSWLQIAITPVLEELALFLLLSQKSKYNFPCSLLSDGSGNTLRHLYLCNCVLRPTVNLSLRYLTKLFLHEVCIAGNELLLLLSSSSSLESLILKQCEDIICLEIPCQLLRLRWLKVFDCLSLQLIEIKAPNISIFDFTGDETQLSLGESLQLKNLTLNRRCAINYAIDTLASSVQNLEALTLRSSREVCSCISEIHFGAQATYGARVFSKFENTISKSHKIMEKILDVDNDVLYQHTKSQPKMTYIMCLAKNDKIWQNLED